MFKFITGVSGAYSISRPLIQIMAKNTQNKTQFVIASSSPEEVRAASHRVVVKVLRGLFTAVILARIGPDEIAHRPKRRRLLEPI